MLDRNSWSETRLPFLLIKTNNTRAYVSSEYVLGKKLFLKKSILLTPGWRTWCMKWPFQNMLFNVCKSKIHAYIVYQPVQLTLRWTCVFLISRNCSVFYKTFRILTDWTCWRWCYESNSNMSSSQDIDKNILLRMSWMLISASWRIQKYTNAPTRRLALKMYFLLFQSTVINDLFIYLFIYYIRIFSSIEIYH